MCAKNTNTIRITCVIPYPYLNTVVMKILDRTDQPLTVDFNVVGTVKKRTVSAHEFVKIYRQNPRRIVKSKMMPLHIGRGGLGRFVVWLTDNPE